MNNCCDQEYAGLVEVNKLSRIWESHTERWDDLKNASEMHLVSRVLCWGRRGSVNMSNQPICVEHIAMVGKEWEKRKQ